MVVLVVIGLLAGVITSISPCVLPVLPVVLTAAAGRGTAAAGSGTPADAPARRVRSWRPYGVVAGLVLSFSVSTLFGSLLLSALHLPQDLLRDAGIAVLVVIGLGLVWPRLGEVLGRPFARLPGLKVDPDSNGIVLGLGLGLLFVPCAGPVLAAIAVVGAAHQVSFGALLLTASFAVGVGLPLLALALAGEAITRRVGGLRRHAARFRVAGGVVMILIAALIGLNLTDGLQRQVPGYTAALQNLVEGNSATTNQLHQLASGGTGGAEGAEPGATCVAGGASLVDCGPAPELTGITGWLNTAGGAPLNLAGLRGKVVLVDFWTYSCINCQRTLPHLSAWYSSYERAGLVILGVHTPEFAFEHVTSNIREQAQALGVRYPIAIDNDYATWNAYHNQYWPAEYLIDPSGTIRHVSFGEGDYATTEELIRQLLVENNPDGALPPSTDVPDTTPADQLTPETYLGYHYAPLRISGPVPTPDAPSAYRFPSALTPGTFALAGTWSAGPEALTAGPDAQLELSYRADDVYLVLGGHGTVTVRVSGQPPSVLAVDGVPQLYPLVTRAGGRSAVLSLSASPGVQAYDFTFG
ncbi:cytochrome c biogenesis protein DipZ [Pseudonocardia sp. Cha107L01]|uniref:cytochrome c biogenesis protein DipZ n=1 Tax=Pseudonocardia sp. Cha107L01 TaxID=3457576 RepID=UPI00403EE3C6